MRVKDVIILKEVSDDLNEGKTFYDQRESGVGDYFWDSLLADIESLLLYAGIHRKEHGFYRSSLYISITRNICNKDHKKHDEQKPKA